MSGHLGLWTGATAALRSIEHRLLSHWGAKGYEEVMAPVLLPSASFERASPQALSSHTLFVTPHGGDALALRSDFTASVACLAARRLTSMEGPARLCYSGVVVRRPSQEGDSEVEAYQAGCERISAMPGPEGDEEIACLAAQSLLLLRLPDAVLELGHWGLVGPLLDRLPWPEEGRTALEQALDRKNVPAMRALGERYGQAAESDLLMSLVHLGGREGEVDALRPELAAAGIEDAWVALCSFRSLLAREHPDLTVRLEPTDVRHFSYYTGLTLKAFTMRHPLAVLSGGRYDGVYPALGRPYGACGFAVHLGRALEAQRSGEP